MATPSKGDALFSAGFICNHSLTSRRDRREALLGRNTFRGRYIESVRRFLGRLGFALCIASGATCVILHIATFIAIIPPVWVLPSFFLMFGAVLCLRAVQSERLFKRIPRNWTLIGVALLVYAVLTRSEE